MKNKKMESKVRSIAHINITHTPQKHRLKPTG